MNDTQAQLPPPSDLASDPDRRTRFNFWRWFWIAFLVASLAYAWYCFYVPSNSIAWSANHASAQQQAAQTNKPIILFFTGQWCVPCRIMKRKVWADEQVTASVNAAFVPVTIDVDEPDAAAVVSRYGVSGTPSTIITDSEGKVLHRHDGAMGRVAFLDLLRTANPSTDPLATQK